jgi:hypothetical protein
LNHLLPSNLCIKMNGNNRSERRAFLGRRRGGRGSESILRLIAATVA